MSHILFIKRVYLTRNASALFVPEMSAKSAVGTYIALVARTIAISRTTDTPLVFPPKTVQGPHRELFDTCML